MSIKTYIQNNPIRSIVLGAAAFAAMTYGSLFVALTKSGERVYNGNINQQKVSYHEDAGNFRVSLSSMGRTHENRMEVKRGDAVFTFIDSEGQNDLDFQAQRRPVGYESDQLERIVVRTPRIGEKVFDSRAISQETLYGLHTGRIFARGNQIYGALRSIMREQLREEAMAGYASVEREFGAIDIRNPKTVGKQEPKPTASHPVQKLRRDVAASIDTLEKEIEDIPGVK